MSFMGYWLFGLGIAYFSKSKDAIDFIGSMAFIALGALILSR